MKNFILFLSIALTFGACKKGQDDVKPKSVAGEIAGTYELTSFRLQVKDDNNDYQYPSLPVVQKGKKTDYGTVTLSETADPNQVNIGIDFTLPTIGIGDIQEEDFVTEVDIKKNGSKYDLLTNGQKFATISGNTLSFDAKTADFHMAFTADR